MYYNPTECGSRIKSLRKAHGFTQEMLAEKLNTVHPHISRIESGKKSASIDMLVEIVALFNVSLDYLILGKDHSHVNMQKQIHSIIAQLEQIGREL